MKLDELEKLARAATPGPWHNRPDHHLQANIYGADEHWVALLPHQCVPSGEVIMHRNEQFLCAFNPGTVLKLIALVRTLTAMLRDAANELGAMAESDACMGSDDIDHLCEARELLAQAIAALEGDL